MSKVGTKGSNLVNHLAIWSNEPCMLKLRTKMQLSLDLQLLFYHIVYPRLVHVWSHWVSFSVLQRFVLKPKLNFWFCICITALNQVEEDFNCAFRDWFKCFRNWKFNFVTVTEIMLVKRLNKNKVNEIEKWLTPKCCLLAPGRKPGWCKLYSIRLP